MSAFSNGPIVAGFDGTDTSVKALRWAAREAALRKCELVIVHAGFYLFEPVLVAEAGEDLTGKLNVPASVTDLAKHAIEVVAAVTPDVRVRTELHNEAPSKALVVLSESAGMVVLGSHATGSLTGVVLGSISQTVAAHARCPVIVINTEQPADAVPRNEVVVGLSPSVGGRQALRFACEEAQRRGATVLAVRAWGDLELDIAGLDDHSTTVQDWKRQEGRTVDECLAGIATEFPGVQIETKLSRVKAQWALEHEAVGAALLVVGCRRADEHWFSRLGPIGSWLLHHAPCPIAVVGRPHESPADTESAALTGR